MKKFFSLLWLKKFQWQVWVRFVGLLLIIPFFILSVVGGLSDRLINLFVNNLPDVPLKKGERKI